MRGLSLFSYLSFTLSGLAIEDSDSIGAEHFDVIGVEDSDPVGKGVYPAASEGTDPAKGHSPLLTIYYPPSTIPSPCPLPLA